MSEYGVAGDVLGAMITPAVLISAGGTLVLSTSNRLSRVVDRVRVLSAEAERLIRSNELQTQPRKRTLLASQLGRLSARALILRSALTALYTAIGFLVATSIGVGVAALVEWRHGWIPVALGLAGACALLYGSLLLVREGRLAVGSTLEEMDYLRSVVDEVGAGKPPA